MLFLLVLEMSRLVMTEPSLNRPTNTHGSLQTSIRLATAYLPVLVYLKLPVYLAWCSHQFISRLARVSMPAWAMGDGWETGPGLAWCGWLLLKLDKAMTEPRAVCYRLLQNTTASLGQQVRGQVECRLLYHVYWKTDTFTCPQLFMTTQNNPRLAQGRQRQS